MNQPEPISTPCSSQVDPRPPSARRRLRWVFMAVALLAIVGLPVLVTGEKRATPPADPPPPDGSRASAAGTPSPEVEHAPTRLDSKTTTEEVEGFGADTVEVPVFDCLPVRKDERAASEQYPVPLPPFSKGIFPCTHCHDRPDDFNPTKRNLTLQHTDIKLVHGPREQWCYGCHNPSDRDKLRLAGGRLISFRKSYELCGQCHGPKLRDWRLGIHGRRTGCWNGPREYRLCVHCHNPHAPKFKPKKPMPRPFKPSEIH